MHVPPVRGMCVSLWKVMGQKNRTGMQFPNCDNVNEKEIDTMHEFGYVYRHFVATLSPPQNPTHESCIIGYFLATHKRKGGV